MDAVGVDELASHVAGVDLRDDPLRSELLVIDLGDSPTSVDDGTRRRLSRHPGPTVGIARRAVAGSLPGLLDVLLTAQAQPGPAGWVAVASVEAAVEDLRAAVAAAPVASRLLLDVLRGGPYRDVDAGLAAESTAYSALLAGPEFARWLAERGEPGPRRERGDPVRVERAGDEVRIVLDRPEVHNALDVAMREALTDALVAVRERSPTTVVLTGAGPSFSAGGDLTEFGTATDVATAHLVRTSRSPARLLAELAPRIVARVHGACIGAGVELAAFAGRVEAAADTSFRLPELSMGLIPGAGGTVSLPARIGRQRTTWLALTGRTLDARDGFAWGLVDAIT